MIHIDVSQLNISQEWKEEAIALTEELRNIADAERADFVNRHSHVWQRLKSELEQISHQKCWYCEAKITRADFHVDHHRPKNRIRNADGTEETGYWWLAFNYRNFRLACSYCNCPHTGPDGVTRGKSDQFPLCPGSIRASSPDSNLDDEIPFLLDPTNPVDPHLLWFLDDGGACPRYSKNDGLLYERARVSIDILNLDDHKIVEARKQLWHRCKNLIERGDRAFFQYQRGSPTGKRDFELVIEEIVDLVQPSSEFSAMARACFRGSARDWARDIVQ